MPCRVVTSRVSGIKLDAHPKNSSVRGRTRILNGADKRHGSTPAGAHEALFLLQLGGVYFLYGSEEVKPVCTQPFDTYIVDICTETTLHLTCTKSSQP